MPDQTASGRWFHETIDAAAPARFDVHLVLDNYGTHKTSLIHRWLVNRPRFHLHFTPTGTSWINQVERWFALLTEKRLRRSAFRSTRELETAIRQYVDQHNEQPKPFRWTKTADQNPRQYRKILFANFRDRTLALNSPYPTLRSATGIQEPPERLNPDSGQS